MGNTLFRRAVLAAALGLGVWAGLARADTPPSPAAPATIVINGIIYANTGVPAAGIAPVQAAVPAAAPIYTPAPSYAPPPISAAPQLAPAPCAECAGDKANSGYSQDGKHRKSCCWAHFNGFGCSSWESEAAFVFGSCRNFFGEPCSKGPPEPAYPGEVPLKALAPNCRKCSQP